MSEPSEGPTVQTRSGAVRGRRERGLEIFLGIPYAHAARFRAPDLPAPWPGVRDAGEFGPVFPQRTSVLPVLFPDPEGARSEDALRINVWTPACDGARRPVLVWVHGGGFVFGAGSERLYDGSALAARGDVVVVTFNYRLGILGFLHHPELVQDQSGNWGSLDQIAALEWVRDHAERFGGDPGRVTVFGESAGAVSIGLLLSSPRAVGLFQRVILQSGVPAATPADAAAECAEAVVRTLGVGARELERLPVEQLLAVQPEWEMAMRNRVRRPGMRPVASSLFGSEPFAPISPEIPVLIGSNADETRIFYWADPRRERLEEPELARRLGLFVEEPAKLISLYREALASRHQPHSPWDLWCAVMTDVYFLGPMLSYIDTLRQSGTRVHRYYFDAKSRAYGGTFGACHGFEIPFVMGTLDRVRGFAGEGPQLERLADELQTRWIAFARDGDPAPAGAAAWPACGDEGLPLLYLGDQTALLASMREPEHRYWRERVAAG